MGVTVVFSSGKDYNFIGPYSPPSKTPTIFASSYPVYSIWVLRGFSIGSGAYWKDDNRIHPRLRFGFLWYENTH